MTKPRSGVPAAARTGAAAARVAHPLTLAVSPAALGAPGTSAVGRGADEWRGGGAAVHKDHQGSDRRSFATQPGGGSCGTGPGRKAGNLPTEVTSFVGRRWEVSEARRLLARTRLLTLTGAGGLGKTRLALRIAAEVRRSFPKGAWGVDLAPLNDGAFLAQTVLTALGLDHDSARPALPVLSDHLADKRLLLVLDNCEICWTPARS